MVRKESSSFHYFISSSKKKKKNDLSVLDIQRKGKEFLTCLKSK